MNRIRYLSLFSGIGAFEKALSNINIEYDIIGYSEIDKWASESYSAIHNVSVGKNLGDITKIETSSINEVDLITYGFPCQDISIAGSQRGICETTRSGLLYEAERIIRDTKPKYAIAENVKNLVGSKFYNDFEELLKRLDSYGYNNYWKVLNSKDFGIPQNRERVFIVSIRKDLDDGTFEFPQGVELTKEFRSMIDRDVDNKYILAEKDYHKVRGLGATYSFGGYVDDGKTVYPTITASYGLTSGNSMKFTRDNKYTILTPLEAWRLMGFYDEDFNKAKFRLSDKFYKNKWRGDSQMYKQAGNSIVVPVLEAILNNLFRNGEMNEIKTGLTKEVK